MKLTIDGQPAEASEGMSLLEAAEARGIHVPALCRYPGLPHVTSCMVCMVEDQHTQSLVPACSTPATEGMRIATDSPLASEARRASLEMLLGDHVGDCEGPCRRGCPAAMDIPAMLRHIAAGRMRDAIRTIKEHIVLPATLGRVCPAPCEKVCRRGFHDAPVGICRLKRFAADVDLAQPSPWRPAIPGPSGFRVAGIGAGPAGLAAAAELRRRAAAAMP